MALWWNPAVPEICPPFHQFCSYNIPGILELQARIHSGLCLFSHHWNPAAIVPLGLFFYMVVWFSLVFVCSSWLGRPGRPDQRGAPAGNGHSKIQLWSACLQWPVFTTKAPSTSQQRTQNLNPSVGLHDLIIISSQVCPEVCFPQPPRHFSI